MNIACLWEISALPIIVHEDIGVWNEIHETTFENFIEL